MKEYFYKTKVCIVGSGFCGYAAYKKLKSKNIDLIIVEGGKKDTPKSSNEQNYYLVNTNKFLTYSRNFKINNKIDPSFRDRKFTLGGSSECWSGWIKPFEKNIYENYFFNEKNQSWGDLRLNIFEKEALSLLKSPIDNFEIKDLTSKLNLNLPKLEEGLYYTAYAWAKEPLRIKNYWIDKVNKSLGLSTNIERKDLFLGYKLDGFSDINSKIKCLKFSNEFNETRLCIEADYFILCMGGIENAKFVDKIVKKLDFQNSYSKYIGNFQEHPQISNIASFNRGKNKLPNICTKRINISDRVHKSFNDGSIKFNFLAWDGPGTPKVSFSINENKEKNKKNQLLNIFKSQLNKVPIPYSDYLINMKCEQTPNVNSKLKFNAKSTQLNWQVNESDFRYYSDYLKRLGAFLISREYAKDFSLSYPSYENYAIAYNIDGQAHHMATVPYLKNKVLINEKFQLSIFKNTYVVGSSAFPVTGFENPTHAAIVTSLIASEDIQGKINQNL